MGELTIRAAQPSNELAGAVPTLAILVVLLATITLFAVRRYSQITSRQIKELAHLVEKNHKRASTWNYHLSRALGARDSIEPIGPNGSTSEEAAGPALSTAPRWEEPLARPTLNLSVVIQCVTDSMSAQEAVAAYIEFSRDIAGVEIVVVGPPECTSWLDDTNAHQAGNRIVVFPVSHELSLHARNNIGIAHASGEYILLVRDSSRPRAGDLNELLSTLQNPEVCTIQGIVMDATDRIAVAGISEMERGESVYFWFQGHPIEDVLRSGGYQIPAGSSRFLLARQEAVRAVGGFNPDLPVDFADWEFAARLASLHGTGHFLSPRACISDRSLPDRENGDAQGSRSIAIGDHLFLRALDQCGFALDDAELGSAGTAARTQSVSARGQAMADLRRRLAQGSQRWGIVIASFAGIKGDSWGDTHFADALRRAIERTGDEAVVHRYHADIEESAWLDDVILVIRGAQRVDPVPGKINLLWVISHPEDLTPDEVRAFDLVFSASYSWGRRMSAITAREIIPLLQAADTDRFSPDPAVQLSSRPLFVGGTYPGRTRRVVRFAESAGVPILVRGNGWTSEGGGNAIYGPYIDNSELAQHYRRAPAVLADHWPAMALEGFIQNRVFDALASGSVVVSDYVIDIDRALGDSVLLYRTPEELRVQCAYQSLRAQREWLASNGIADHVRAEHSFDARVVVIREHLKTVHQKGQ